MDAFSAMKKTGQSGGDDSVTFDSIFTTPGSSFNRSTSSLTPTSAAIYWMHLSIDVPSFTRAYMYLNGLAQEKFAIVKNHTLLDATDTMNRDGVVNVTAKAAVTLVCIYPTVATTGITQPLWAAFRMDNLFRPLIAFHVALSTFLFATANVTATRLQPIAYDLVLLNSGNGWNGSAFVVPQQGTYFLCFGAQFSTSTSFPSTGIYLSINGTRWMAAQSGLMERLKKTKDVDLTTKCCLVNLNAGDGVSMTTDLTLRTDTSVFGTYFTGFLYNPISKLQV